MIGIILGLIVGAQVYEHEARKEGKPNEHESTHNGNRRRSRRRRSGGSRPTGDERKLETPILTEQVNDAISENRGSGPAGGSGREPHSASEGDPGLIALPLEKPESDAAGETVITP